MFLVVLRRSGPDWQPELALEAQSDWPAHAAFMDGLVDAGFVVLGGPLADEERVVHAVESEAEEVIRATLAGDPWCETHLVIETIDPWTIRLDGRSGAPRSSPAGREAGRSSTASMNRRVAADGTRFHTHPGG